MRFPLGVAAGVPIQFRWLPKGFTQPGRYSHELGCDRRIASFRGNRKAAVAGFASGNIDGDLAEQRDPDVLCFAFAPARAEDIVALTVPGTLEVAHVFDETEDRDVDLLEHGRGFARI